MISKVDGLIHHLSLMLVYLILALFCSANTLRAESALDLFTVNTTSIALERSYDAEVEAVKQATITAETSGSVVKLLVDVDDYVKKGELLIQFRDTKQRARFNSAQAQYEEALASFKRSKELLGKNLISKSGFDQAEAALKTAQAQRDEAKEVFEHTRVYAPYSGIVTKRHIEVGESARIGQALLSGVSLESLRVKTFVPQEVIGMLRQFNKARVILPGNHIIAAENEALTISPYADPKTHTFQVRVNIPVGITNIYPGMFAKVAFTVGEQQTMLIPRQTVVQRSEVSAVYRQDETGRVYLQQIRLGKQFENNMVEVLSGLDVGDKIALNITQASSHINQQRKE